MTANPASPLRMDMDEQLPFRDWQGVEMLLKIL
jgi:hypothetical protein